LFGNKYGWSLVKGRHIQTDSLTKRENQVTIERIVWIWSDADANSPS
jgi:hypothetical protein